MQRQQVRAPALVGGREARGEARGDGVELRLRRLAAHPVAQQADGEERPLVAPRFGTRRVGQPDVVAHRKVEAGRHDADNGELATIDGDGAADDRGIGAEAPPPERVADQRHRLMPDVGAVLGPEAAAARRLDAEQREETRRHRAAAHALGADGPTSVTLRSISPSIGRERARLAEVDEVGVRDAGVVPVARLGRVGGVDADEARRALAEGERPQDERVDDAEDESRRAHAEREDGDRRQRQAARLGEASNRYLEIPHRHSLPCLQGQRISTAMPFLGRSVTD